MLQRIGLVLVSVGLGLILGVMALMAIDGMHPGRVAPVLAAWLAGGAGLAIIAGLRLVERGREPLEFCGFFAVCAKAVVFGQIAGEAGVGLGVRHGRLLSAGRLL